MNILFKGKWNPDLTFDEPYSFKHNSLSFYPFNFTSFTFIVTARKFLRIFYDISTLLAFLQ